MITSRSQKPWAISLRDLRARGTVVGMRGFGPNPIAQRSILGPALWNASYDSLLRAEMPEETCLVGYAALIAARDVELNHVMRAVNGWMIAHGLSLALDKAEIVIFTKKRISTVLPMKIGDMTVKTRTAAWYLGITIDSRVTFWEQIRRTADKAAQDVTALSRLMANVRGPKSSKRRLLMSAVQAVLLYGAEIWAGTVSKETCRKLLGQVQSRSVLRIASAYSTV